MQSLDPLVAIPDFMNASVEKHNQYVSIDHENHEAYVCQEIL